MVERGTITGPGRSMDATSASLLARVRQLGDVEAWDRFARAYSPVLYGWVRQMG